MKVLLLHNPSAGQGDHRGADLEAALSRKGMSVTYRTVDDGLEACGHPDVDALVIAGGDGTVRKVLTHVIDRKIPFGIIPLGGSNNVATTLGFAAETVLRGRWPDDTMARPFHMGQVTGEWGQKSFIEGVGFGVLAASVGCDTPPSRRAEDKLAQGRRVMAGALETAEALAVTVTVDGMPVDGLWLMTEVLARRHSGPRLPLVAPKQVIAGQLSVVLLDDTRRRDMMEWLKDPNTGPPPVTVLSGRSVTLHSSQTALLRIDDKTRSAAAGTREAIIDREPLRALLPLSDHS